MSSVENIMISIYRQMLGGKKVTIVEFRNNAWTIYERKINWTIYHLQMFRIYMVIKSMQISKTVTDKIIKIGTSTSYIRS
jgi:hypothetical protein